MKEKNASHYQRLSGYGLEKDIKYCLTADIAKCAGGLRRWEN